MDDERVVEEIVTKFLLSTYRLHPQLSWPAIQAAVHCATTAAERSTDDTETHNIPLITGSVAEFYIEPMLPHVGDIDVMLHLSTELAIPRGQSPPTQLPDEFSNYVLLYDIIDSHLLGYVYLESRYLLTECSDSSMYNAVEYDRGYYLLHSQYTDDPHQLRNCWPMKPQFRGPAITVVPPGTQLSLDAVYCVRCLLWPPQAADWPTRRRNYSWPDSATVDRVVNNGCDVVGAAHRQCRQDEWMRQPQCRLSFSRAEIVLISSWMPVQQIVYHNVTSFHEG